MILLFLLYRLHRLLKNQCSFYPGLLIIKIPALSFTCLTACQKPKALIFFIFSKCPYCTLAEAGVPALAALKCSPVKSSFAVSKSSFATIRRCMARSLGFPLLGSIQFDPLIFYILIKRVRRKPVLEMIYIFNNRHNQNVMVQIKIKGYVRNHTPFLFYGILR